MTLTRREFLELGALGAATIPLLGASHTDCEICVFKASSDERSGLDVWVVRSADLLSLHFHLNNLRIRTGLLSQPRLELVNPAVPAYLTVEFPPQHVAELAIRKRASQCDVSSEQLPSPPVASRATDNSRLVFRIPETLLPLPYCVETLLKWKELNLITVPLQREPGAISKPKPLESAIEALYRLFLTFPPDTQWQHSIKPKVRNGWTELWHTKLTVPSKTSQVLLDAADSQPDLRPKLSVAWSPDYSHLSNPDPFLSSLTAADRRELVTLSHDASRCATPVRANFLALSSLGSWVDVEGHWPKVVGRPGNLDKWEHRATMGRDQKVVVQRRGFLYPFGHKAVWMKETQREINDVRGQNENIRVAFLRQSQFVVLQEPVRTYDLPTMCFRVLTFEDLRTPPLDDPTSDDVKKVDGSGWGDIAFWPNVCGHPFEFRITGLDYQGAEVNFSAPVIFVQDLDFVSCEPTPIPGPPPMKDVIADVKRNYEGNPPRRYRSLNGQRVALAESIQVGDTEVEGESFALEADWLELSKPSCEQKCEPFPPETDRAPFEPTLSEIRARLPAARRLVPDGDGAAWFKPIDLKSTGVRQIFAIASRQDKIQASFHSKSDRSGGVVAPTPSINALSRAFGPVGVSSREIAVKAFSNSDTFEASAFFDDEATILGILPLSKIVANLPAGERGAVPAMVSRLIDFGDTPDVFTERFDWSTRHLQNWPSSNPIFERTDETSLEIAAVTEIRLDPSAMPTARIEGVLRRFKVRVVFGDVGGFIVSFRQLRFDAGIGEKTRVSVDIENVDFVGAALKFVQQLKEWLGFDKAGGLNIDVNSRGIALTTGPIKLGDISFGVISLENIVFRTGCSLPFTSEPISFLFEFSRRDSPCVVNVGYFAGAGFFGIEVDTDRIRRLEASIEFGAYKALSFGSVARGSLYLMGGIYYGSKTATDPEGRLRTEVVFIAFVRAGGSVTAFGFISVSIELYVALQAISDAAGTSLTGIARFSATVKIGFFKRSFTITYSQRFAGSSSEPRALSISTLGYVNDEYVFQFRRSEWQTYYSSFIRGIT
jgi:hypothetical protein